MTVIAVQKDLDARTLVVTAEFAAPPERIWRLWSERDQLQRWWGPPQWPATFTTHDLSPGSMVRYHMTGPGGERPGGWWRIGEVDPPRLLTFQDGFAKPDGSANDDLPVTDVRVTFEPIPTGTRMAITSRYASTEALQQVLDMGMEEGMTLALGQVDGILAEDPA